MVASHSTGVEDLFVLFARRGSRPHQNFATEPAPAPCLIKKAQHSRLASGPFGIGIRAVCASPRPGVPGAVHLPMLLERLPIRFLDIRCARGTHVLPGTCPCCGPRTIVPHQRIDISSSPAKDLVGVAGFTIVSRSPWKIPMVAPPGFGACSGTARVQWPGWCHPFTCHRRQR